MRTGRVGRAALAFVSVAAVAFAASGAAAGCARPHEKVALESRVLQSELMVAALSCGQAAEYNAFVRKFQPELFRRGLALKDYFARLHGRGGEQQMNRFVTVMANEASSRNVADQDSFCAQAGTLFDQLRSLDPPGYVRFVGTLPLAETHGVNVCQGVPAADSGTAAPASAGAKTSAFKTVSTSPDATSGRFGKD